MSSRPWFRWFPGDHKVKTAHLDFVHDCAYRKLLDAYYSHDGPLPADSTALCRIAGAQTPEEQQAVLDVSKEFFTNGDGRIKHHRCDEELSERKQFHDRKVEAGTRGGLSSAQAKLKRSSSRAKAVLKPSSSQSQSHSQLQPDITSTEGEAIASSPATHDVSAAGLVVISIPLNDSTEYPITQPMIDEWQRLYAECDVLQTLREVRGWNLANPTKRKTRTGVLNHINRWLAKEHNRG